MGERQKISYSRYKYESATSDKKGYVKWLRELVQQIDNDTDKAGRISAAECPVCYYRKSKIGGARMTFRECAFCSGRISSGNTTIGIACVPCAKQHGICSFCGADLNLIMRRKAFING